MRLYYLEKDPASGSHGNYYYGDNEKRICWLTSPDSASWTFGGCLTNKTWTDGVSAAFDPYGHNYVITWIDDTYVVNVAVVPGVGSSVVGTTVTNTGYKSWENPSIACANVATGCEMVFMSRSPTGYLITLRGNINSYGTWSTTNAFNSYYDLDQSATPNISYQWWDGKFVLAYLKRDMTTLRSYKKALADTTWSQAATIATTTYSFSAPALGNEQFCFFGCNPAHVVAFALLY